MAEKAKDEMVVEETIIPVPEGHYTEDEETLDWDSGKERMADFATGPEDEPKTVCCDSEDADELGDPVEEEEEEV